MKHGTWLMPLVVMTTGCTSMIGGTMGGTMGAGMSPGFGRPLAAPIAPAAAQVQAPLPVGRWDSVMRVPVAATLDVLGHDGTATVGPKLSADGDSVVLQVAGQDLRIRRADVLRIDLVDLPGSELRATVRGAARGALLGAGAVALFGAVVGGSAWPPPGALLRGGAVVGGIAGGHATLQARQGQIIYLAESRRHP